MSLQETVKILGKASFPAIAATASLLAIFFYNDKIVGVICGTNNDPQIVDFGRMSHDEIVGGLSRNASFQSLDTAQRLALARRALFLYYGTMQHEGFSEDNKQEMLHLLRSIQNLGDEEVWGLETFLGQMGVEK